MSRSASSAVDDPAADWNFRADVTIAAVDLVCMETERVPGVTWGKGRRKVVNLAKL